ncbi:MAG TPA: hypothetical protein VHZ25_17775 [Acidobacteriaceae bacterium]|jgi:hypothetical protein|nr:hypothetical protein [Acidobacteriaceae bacterium]
MSELIKPILDRFALLLNTMTMPNGLTPFATIGRAWTGLLVNPPGAWVMPGRTAFPNQGEGTTRSQIHAITIRLGLTGADPEELTARALAYVQAVDAAIEELLDVSWPDFVKYVYVVEHDYGSMWTKGQGSVAMWPDIHCQVEVEELR